MHDVSLINCLVQSKTDSATRNPLTAFVCFVVVVENGICRYRLKKEIVRRRLFVSYPLNIVPTVLFTNFSEIIVLNSFPGPVLLLHRHRLLLLATIPSKTKNNRHRKPTIRKWWTGNERKMDIIVYKGIRSRTCTRISHIPSSTRLRRCTNCKINEKKLMLLRSLQQAKDGNYNENYDDDDDDHSSLRSICFEGSDGCREKKTLSE